MLHPLTNERLEVVSFMSASLTVQPYTEISFCGLYVLNESTQFIVILQITKSFESCGMTYSQRSWVPASHLRLLAQIPRIHMGMESTQAKSSPDVEHTAKDANFLKKQKQQNHPHAAWIWRLKSIIDDG